MDASKERISELASLIDEFGLDEAQWHDGEFGVKLVKKTKVTEQMVPVAAGVPSSEEPEPVAFEDPVPEAPRGTPVTSPMNGIFYSAPNPNAKQFAEVGATVTAGQVVGLIEAMKMFNEIFAPVSGRVLSITAENGQVVAPGDVLLSIG